jgi:hypothetical protein
LLSDYATGAEDFMTGGWVRVITPPSLFRKEWHQVKALLDKGNGTDHGTYRGVRLIEFAVNNGGRQDRSTRKGFGS